MFELPENIGNKYRFVTIAALRAEQLQLGARPRVESSSRKPTLIAQEEVAAGLVQPIDESAAPEPGEGEGESAE
jgi:DNA-directed RNA polymerase omega subunit